MRRIHALRRSFRLGLLSGACAILLGAPAQAVDIQWTTVGGAGNAADTTGFGAVADTYRIGVTEVTNSQYAEFLNAVAASDTNSLYTSNMAGLFGGIQRSGSSGSFTYNTIAGRESVAVSYVSYYDALRFANWLHNGQPTGAQGAGTTEDGAYTITASGLLFNSITRNANANIFLPSEDEWYKAAYYNAVSASYLAYPAGLDLPTACATPGAGANTANCNGVVGNLVAVGSYTGSASPNGAFDMGGNVSEWNDTVVFGGRGLRGGNLAGGPGLLASSFRDGSSPANENAAVGFRVAMVPEPGTGLLVMGGILAMALRRRRTL